MIIKITVNENTAKFLAGLATYCEKPAEEYVAILVAEALNTRLEDDVQYAENEVIEGVDINGVFITPKTDIAVSVENTPHPRDQIEEILDRHRVAHTEEDIAAVGEYLSGDRRSGDYDRLSAWVRMCVDLVLREGHNADE